MRSILLVFVLLLSACGLKDDLYLPEAESDEPARTTQRPAAINEQDGEQDGDRL